MMHLINVCTWQTSKAYQQRIISQWSVTIGKFLRSIDYFSFRSFNIGDHFTFVIFSHPWPFCIGDRFDLVFVLTVAVIVRFAIWSVYSTFSCSFRDWDRWSLQRSPFVLEILICCMNILFVLPNCIFYPIHRP